MKRLDSQYEQAVKAVREDPRSKYCFLSGGKIRGRGDPHHVIPASHSPSLLANKRNIVIVNRTPHNIITNGTAAQIKKLPGIHRLLARMKELDYEYYNRYKQKLNEGNTNSLDGLR